MASETLLFYLFGGIAALASLLVIAQRNPIHSVIFLIAAFGALSGLYVLLEAPFIAVIQIIVYAGAIMVLFLFVVMLLNAPVEEVPPHGAGPARASLRPGTRSMRFGALLAVAFAIELVWALNRAGVPSQAFGREAVSSVPALGRLLFTQYAFPFEVTSVLILVAMVGAVMLARREERAENTGRSRGPR